MNLIGKKVWHKTKHAAGVITAVTGNIVTISFHGREINFKYPDAFASSLEFEDEEAASAVSEVSSISEFDFIKQQFIRSINREINYLRTTGGRKYKLFDGTVISEKNGRIIYSFDADTELHFPNDTQIRIVTGFGNLYGIIISCEDYAVLIQTYEAVPGTLKSIEFYAEPWQLLDALKERVSSLSPKDRIAYEVACQGRFNSSYSYGMDFGQELAIKHAVSQLVTVIWGPPGTGKTQTLAKIAYRYIMEGKRVLMLSYSNVSVDGAILRVAEELRNANHDGMIIRYGYPRRKEILEDRSLSSYQYVLTSHPDLDKQYQILQMSRKNLRRDDPRKAEISKELASLRKQLIEEEKALVQQALFIATTVSKAVVDSAIYTQRFDLVLFDEASMAYVPHVVFAASLAKDHFVCLGDFRQLPAIVQCPDNKDLKKDIFEHTGITGAVEKEVGHEWLVMLNRQYRMHPDIAEFVSERMYSNALVSGKEMRDKWKEVTDEKPFPGCPMGLLDFSGLYSVSTKTPDGSRINILSALICARYADILSEHIDMGIITPYNAQSRLILSMIRDMQEDGGRQMKVTCATVHQFQGSERGMIIYDAVDCFRMRYPGTLLTSKENQTADRLFNVAITRSRGKFVIVCNRDYFRRKKTSSDLLFMNAVSKIERLGKVYKIEEVFSEVYTDQSTNSHFYIGNDQDAWEIYLKDIRSAKDSVYIDIPGTIDDGEKELQEFTLALTEAANRNVRVVIRREERMTLPDKWSSYTVIEPYVCMPVTIIDSNILWYNQPLSNADFFSEGEIVATEYYPRIRFQGQYTVRSVMALLEMKA